jgi:putative DNA primase/helicase
MSANNSIHPKFHPDNDPDPEQQLAEIDRLLAMATVTPLAEQDNDPAPADELPQIVVTNRQLSDLMNETMVAIADHSKRSDPLLFVRSGRLVRLASDENGALRTDLITADALLGIMARVARWVSVTQGKDGGAKVVNVSPPALVSRVLCAAAGWDLPVLEGIAHAPIFDANGTLHTEQGYNTITRLYHAGTVKLGDTTPTRANLAAAVALLTDDLFVDFPLDAASRAHAIALAILPFVRPMIRGATPLHLATAPQHRAGKSLLVESALYPALGRTPDMTADAGDETEWAKVLTSKLLSSPSVVVLDNLSAELRSPMLATAIVEARLTSRILGSNTEVSAPARWVWAATARNPTLHEELMLRSVLIRLTPKTERPEERSGFKHGNQLDWVTANRNNLVTAIVTIVRNWIENANRKPYAGRAKGRFESWVATMGGILAAAGIEGFLDNEKELRSTSAPEADAFRNFVLAWWETHGSDPVTVSNELFKLASTPDDDKLTPGNDILGEVLGNTKEHGRKVALGRLLKQYAGRVYEETPRTPGQTPRSFRVEMHEELARSKARQWFLAEISAESQTDSALSTTSDDINRGVSRSLPLLYVEPTPERGDIHHTSNMAECQQTPRDSATPRDDDDLKSSEMAWLDDAEAEL